MQTSRTNALLSAAAVSVLALSQWSLSGDSVSAAGAPGTLMLAQAQPKCGQDPQHPCPKGPQPQPKQVQPPPPKQAQPQPQPQPKQVQPPPPKQAQPQPQPQPLPKQVQPPPPKQAQPQPQPVPKQLQPQVQPLPKQAQPQPQPVPKQLTPQTQPLPKQAQPQPQPLPKQLTPPTQPLPKQAQPLPKQPGTPGAPPAVTFQRRVPPPGQPQPNRPGVTPPPPAPTVVNVQQLKEQRHEHVEANGRVVIEEPDHRFIERDRGQVFIRHDENERMERFEEGRVERRRDGIYTVFVRPDGDEIISVTDNDGRLIRRIRRDRFGHEFILIDNRPPVGGLILALAPPVIRIPQDQYIVDTAVAPEPLIFDALAAPPLVPIERPYTLDEIRFNVALRDRMRRIDIDTITFDTGSWEVGPGQINLLQYIAQAIRDLVARNPNEMFLIEGHTDAVGSDEDNLSLSDRRAETVADILTETFQIPPENLTTQGYGAHFLKIQTPDANRLNRRVTVRRITPLLAGSNG